MKKVLIISYFFPPANFAGSYRIASWARHLHKFGYYPVIVTRCWNENQVETTDEVIDNNFSHEKYDTYEVYRLPYYRNLKDRLHGQYRDRKFKLLRKFLTMQELLLQHYSNAVIPYHNLYEFSRELIKRENDFVCLITSGKPFQLFKFGSQLHEETGIKWIADYRDEWNTEQWIDDGSWIRKVIRAIELKSEKEWLRNAALFTTCSVNWRDNIGHYINRPGRVLLNGYEDSLMEQSTEASNGEIYTIVHNGSLYDVQPVEVFLNGFKKFVDAHPGAKVQILFPGVENQPAEGDRIRKELKGYENYFSTSPRIPKSELVKIMASAHLFLMIGTQGVKGHHSSKIFEYLAMKRPIILCPDDNDVMSELIQETRGGFVLHTAEEVSGFLAKAYSGFIAGSSIGYSPDLNKIAFYSREKQAQILSEIIREVEESPSIK